MSIRIRPGAGSSPNPGYFSGLLKNTLSLFLKEESISEGTFKQLLNPIKENLYNFIYKEIRTMRKIIILILVILLMFSGLAFGDNNKAKEETKKQSSSPDTVTKTYFLKHISPKTVERALHAYFFHSSFDSNVNMITVKIPKENIDEFEELLKKMDVEKRKILIRIFTVIASNEGKSGEIENKDLKQVLSELQKILSFKSYRLDGVSALTVIDGQSYSDIILSSSSLLEFSLKNIKLSNAKVGQRSISFSFFLDGNVETSHGVTQKKRLIRSETSIKENGYLVAGVSKIGKNGDSLVLVINAEIK